MLAQGIVLNYACTRQLCVVVVAIFSTQGATSHEVEPSQTGMCKCSHLCNLPFSHSFHSTERKPPHDDDESGMGTSITTDEKSKISSEVSTHLF